ncbi:Chorismate synthase [Kitasatospora sp. MMS16-BH015]|nr:Chorismate synthase [Kitasatospora sp. MMS16-BH015]
MGAAVKCAALLTDAFGRVRETVHDVLEGLTAEELAARLDPAANSIAWLVWHLTRVQDDHLADAAGTEQVWTTDGWYERFALPFPARATGYGHRSAEVAAVRPDGPQLLAGYHDAVHERTLAFVQGLTGSSLDRVVDESWTPSVTLGVRLVSVVSEGLQHVGQAAFLRGVLRRQAG